jgi:hypothetical protein
MKTAGDYRAEAEHLRELAKTVTDPALLDEMAALVEEYDRRARELENGAD